MNVPNMNMMGSVYIAHLTQNMKEKGYMNHAHILFGIA
jgi:hypothetical protein